MSGNIFDRQQPQALRRVRPAEPPAAGVPEENLVPGEGRSFQRARISRQALPMLALRSRQGNSRAFPYHGLGPLEFDPSRGIVFLVTTPDARSWRVTIRGRNLGPVHDSLFFQRAEWIQEQDPNRDSARDEETVVYQIAIEAVQE